MSSHPSGWGIVRLGDIADTALGKMLDAARPTGRLRVPYLRNVNVQWGHIDTADVREVTLSAAERDRFAVEPGDLLICEGGEIGRAAIWRGSGHYVAYQKALHRVRSRGDLDLTYLRYLMEHFANTGELRDRATGSTILHLPQQKLRELPIPLPPLAEQRRIVELLEEHLSRLDATRLYLGPVTDRAVMLDKLQLDKELAGSHAHPIPLGELLAEPLTNGRSVPTAQLGFPVLRLTCLKGNRVDLGERKIGAWKADDAAHFLVQRGDFLVARGNGTLRLVGRGGLVTDDPDPVAFPDTLIRIRPHTDLLTPRFLSLVWNTTAIRRQIERAARTTAGIYKVNQRDLQRVLVPVATIEQQQRILSVLEAHAARTERVASAVGLAERRGQTLRRALLDAAFSGRLRRDRSATASPEVFAHA